MKSTLIAWLLCCLLSSCQSTYDIGLKSMAEVEGAKRVAVCQSEALDRAAFYGSEGMSSFIFGGSKMISLPSNYSAQAVAVSLPKGINAKVIQGLEQPMIAANRVVPPHRKADYASVYEPISPMKNYDLIIHICPSAAAATSAGYYNAGAGAYIPSSGGIGSEGGYRGGYDPIIRTTTFSSMFDIYVYRGSDGKCLGSFYLSFPTISKKVDAMTAWQKHIHSTASLIVYRIFGAQK